ncbi:M24 family metallopeptidase [Pseudohoeflea coraliihabitans]|uniref:Xaa-Pro peptidase family protein n=1 Tax=Pseudohoeflea coraliihabitans TaxID=2860393 RepID=A0ABS6WJY5_9HYPH|nr:Xaa-Pro peptidase family protein [Pseudohoeflea sp. DP4N28-3]MBW3096257.1 Xaa-Pro peptidase family protein [Pseudohoeflea sp. DP4N28-3]
MGLRQAFDHSEFHQRIERVQSAMADSGLDVLLLHSPENIYYLTGYQTSGYFAYQVAFVPKDGPIRLLVRFLEHGNVGEYSWLEEADTWREGDDLVARTCGVLRETAPGAMRIGLEKQTWFLTAAMAEAVSAAVSPAEIVDASLLVDRVRLVKSPAEIACLRAAGRIAEIEQKVACDRIGDGVTEAEVAAAVFEAGILAGCEYTGLPHHIMSGYRYDVCHANWTSKPIVNGEMVLLELYGCVERYHATQMRTVCLGSPTSEVRDAVDLIIAAQDAAIAALRPGASALEVDRLVREPIRSIRPDYFNRSGYSTGIGFPPRTAEWDAADFNEHVDWEVKEGMVFHMLGLAKGFGISETVAVTRDGSERLTPDNARELFIK